jgi:hypothetical protein
MIRQDFEVRIILSIKSGFDCIFGRWHGDFLLVKLPIQLFNEKQVFSIPESGLSLIDYINPFNRKILQEYIINLFKLMNPSVGLAVSDCQIEFYDLIQCHNANRIAKYLKSPFFVVRSPYDLW